jgi:hypothetical protein
MKYIVAVVVVVVIFVTITILFTQKEKFTDDKKSFSDSILALFKAQEPPSYVGYLAKLNELQNTSDALISKEIYKEFLRNPNLSILDIEKLVNK